MDAITRRNALTALAGAGITAALGLPAHAAPKDKGPDHPSNRPGKGQGSGGAEPTPEPPAPVQAFGPWTALGSHPSAEAHRPWRGHGINAMQPYQGRLYLGYGNWNSNSGGASRLGVDIAWYDPITGEFGIDATGMPGEAIEVFREIDGRLFVPNTDPTGSRPGSFFSNVSGEWLHGPGTVSGEHMFDVCGTGVPGELFLVGSDGRGTLVNPTVWRSIDNGVTWEVFFQEPFAQNAARNGYERFYWLAHADGKIYCRAAGMGNAVPLRVFDTAKRQWTTQKMGLGKANRIELAAQQSFTNTFQSTPSMWYGRSSGWSNTEKYAWCDGKKAGWVSGITNFVNHGSKTDDGRVLIKQQDGIVHLIEGTAAIKIAEGAGTSVALLGGRLYTAFDGVLHVAEQV